MSAVERNNVTVSGTGVQPMLFAHFVRLVLVGPSPRYVNDEDYVGGFAPEETISAIKAFVEA